MANPQDVRKVGAHSNQETRPCDSSSPRPTVAPDSQQPPTGRKRKHRTLSSEHQNTSLDSLEYREHPAKRRKPSIRSCSASPSSTHPSRSTRDRAEREYWDSVSDPWLTSDALRELNRRNRALRANALPTADTPACLKQRPKDITHFALHGGPDLSDIRKYRNPEENTSTPTTMSSRGDGTVKRSSAYNMQCGRDLAKSSVFAPNYNERPANYQEWEEAMIQRRASLSPSRSSDASFKSFRNAVCETHDEADVVATVFPRVIGKGRPPAGRDVQIGHMTPLTPKIVKAKPDYYEGIRPGLGNRTVQERLDRSIVPSEREGVPILPTFFVEAKGPDGTISVAQRQLRHDGALGSRAMHSVQTLGRKERYDNKAYTASALIDGGGHLDMFTHHMTQPLGRNTPAHTHMTPIGSWGLTHSPQVFREGRTALRNASDKAFQHRERAIQGANRRLGTNTPQGSQLVPRSTRKPLSCQTPAAKSSDPDSSSSSEEEEDSDDGDYETSSRRRPRGKQLKPKMVSIAPPRSDGRSLSPGPMTRRRKTMVSRHSNVNDSSEDESSKAPRRRQLSKARVITASPKRPARRDSSPPIRDLRPRRGSRRP